MAGTVVITNGLDALDVERTVESRFPSKRSPFRDDILAACREVGLAVGLFETGRSSPVWGVASDDVRLSVKPGSPSGTRLACTIESRPLHVSPASSWAESEAMLDLSEALLTEGDPTETRLKKVALHADFIGGKIGRETVSRLRRRTRMPMRIEDNGTFLGVHVGRQARPNVRGEKFFNCYNKSVDIEHSPAKAYIQDQWREGGWAEDMGDVWRVEYTFSGRRLTNFENLASLWTRGLDSIKLTRKRRGAAGRQEDPLWRDHLRRLQFHAPWDIIDVARPAVMPQAWRRKLAAGRILAGLHSLGAPIGLDAWSAEQIGNFVLDTVLPLRRAAPAVDPGDGLVVADLPDEVELVVD